MDRSISLSARLESCIVESWQNKVNFRDHRTVAKFINDMPYAEMKPIEELFEIADHATELAGLTPVTVHLRTGHLVIGPGFMKRENYQAFGGTHHVYGNFASLWSPRGFGNRVRPRACFILYDRKQRAA